MLLSSGAELSDAVSDAIERMPDGVEKGKQDQKDVDEKERYQEKTGFIKSLQSSGTSLDALYKAFGKDKVDSVLGIS